jgi:hypothetical protein
MDSPRFEALIQRIDHLNSQDPTTTLVKGISTPRELAYSQQVTEWVLRLNPGASEALRIAARGQHLCRWTIPRDRYARNRQGYLRWRETLKAFHVQEVAKLMREAGYPDETIERVRAIMSKQHLKSDPDTQTLEDALCLVFLETQYADLRKKTPDEAMKDVLRKTWQKMSERGRAAAARLPLGEGEKALLNEALAG